MTEQNRPNSYPVAYTLIIIITLFLLIFTGGPAHKPVVKNKERNTPTKKNSNVPIRKKSKKPVKKEAKNDSTTEVFSIDDKTVSTGKKKTDAEYFEQIKTDYQNNVYSKLKRPADRTDLVIRYYKKEKDIGKVSALKNLGFYVHERPSDNEYVNFGSNAIYYGDSVKRSDIEIIAYTLIQAGLDLKVITPSMYHDTWKANSLEIGTDTTAVDLPVLKLSDIREKWGQN